MHEVIAKFNPRRWLLLGIVAAGASVCAAGEIKPDLAAIAGGKGWKGDLHAVTLTNKDNAPVVEFKPLGKEHLIWLEDFAFTNGVIEFDCRGRSAPRGSSFVGVAFRVADARAFDAVYFRPFNFRADNPDNRAHAVQYMSLPDFPWNRLRAEKPGQYEKGLEPAPDGDAWIHARIVIERPEVRVFVNGAAQPSLVVDELSGRTGGSVGLWCNGFGMVSNLRITLAK